jgi:hypothetical protein
MLFQQLSELLTRKEAMNNKNLYIFCMTVLLGCFFVDAAESSNIKIEKYIPSIHKSDGINIMVSDMYNGDPLIDCAKLNESEKKTIAECGIGNSLINKQGDENYWIVACKNNKLVAVCYYKITIVFVRTDGCDHNCRTCYIKNIYTSTEEQREQVYTRLIDYVWDWCVQKEVKVTEMTIRHDNITAKQVLERKSFVEANYNTLLYGYFLPNNVLIRRIQ